MTSEDIPEATLAPHDDDAERAIIGSVLKQPAVVATLTDLAPEDFYDPRYRTIWRAMLDQWNRSKPIDYTALAARLAAPDMAKHTSLADLAEISMSIPSAANVAYYAELVTAAATQRRYIAAAQTIAERAWPRGVDIEALATDAEGLLTAARPRRSRSDLFDPERWAEAFRDDLDLRASGERTAVTTGLLDLDGMTLGLEAGGLYLLMGTPGSGKTELAMQIGMHVASDFGPVLFASLEMSAVELAHRFARISRGLDRNRLAKGALTDEENSSVLLVMNDMHSSRFWPASPRGWYTTTDLRSDACEVRSRVGKVALIVADYVQRFRDRGSNTSSREENVGLVAENLKSLAREFGCPVLAPVQPNREYVMRSSKRPILSDLRESGKLEQEADVVLGLYRDEKHDDQTKDRGVAEVHMLKNRSGVGDSEGMRKLVWQQTRYANYAAPRAALPWAG